MAMAVAEGAAGRTSHSTRKSVPLAAKADGTRIAGLIRAAALAWTATSRIEKNAAAINIAGSAETLSDVRNSASRVALPPTISAETAAAQRAVRTRRRLFMVLPYTRQSSP